jgi:hypothetical protein
VDDVLAVEVVGDVQALREDVVEHKQLVLRPERLPAHVLLAEVELHVDVVVAEDRHVVVEVLALEGVRHDSLVLHADQVVVAGVAQRDDGALELPRRGVRRREREVPGDVVLEHRRRRRVEVLPELGQFHQPLVVLQHRLRIRRQDGDLGLGSVALAVGGLGFSIHAS